MKYRIKPIRILVVLAVVFATASAPANITTPFTTPVHDTAYALGATISYSGTVTYVCGTDSPPTLITVNLRYDSVLSGTITDSHQSAPTVFMGSGSWNGGVIARQDPGFHKATYFLQAVPENSGTTTPFNMQSHEYRA